MIIIEKNEGPKVPYEQDGTVLTFAGGDLALDCAIRQRDYDTHIDICANADGNLVIGTITGQNYVAQLDIPAREYEYPTPDESAGDEGDEDADGMTGDSPAPTPIPLDMDKVTLTLWAIGA
jgi:hypothetical protein